MRLLNKVSFWIVMVLLTATVLAQSPSSTLSGKVTDQTGAVIPGAEVTVTAPSGKSTTTTTDGAGGFQVDSLAPGSYTVNASASGFATKSQTIQLNAGQPTTVSLSLEVRAQEEKVHVEGGEGRPQLDVSAESNASSLVIKGKDLEALSDDPDELQSELQALAGPSAGPNGGQIYIDGFTGGALPPKSSIREIRVNQNPFSAQYDRLGYGRIEIFTKPGGEKYHGQFFFNDNNAVLNSRNPYVFTPKPSYNSEMFDGNFGGPMGKKASFFLDASRRNIDEFAAINATVLDSNFAPVHFTQSLPNPRTRTNFSPRFDFQLSQNNTLSVRYHLSHDTDQNAGLSQFLLPSQAYNSTETDHTIQVGDSQVLSTKAVNETRFRWERDISHQSPVSTATATQVQGAFSTGGNSEGSVRETEDDYEFQNYTSISHGNHFIKFGARIRATNQSTFANPNFNGTIVFSPVVDPITGQVLSALQVFQNAQQNGCSQSGSTSCPSQIRINTGQPRLQFNLIDAGLYAEDDWRVRPNLSVNYGLRFESQNDIHDHADFAPRVGLAWGIGSNGKGTPQTVLRAGFGIFYDRFGENLLENTYRYSGGPGSQQSITLTNPNFYSPQVSFSQVEAAAGAAVAPTTYNISPDIRAPYTMQSAVSIERQVTKDATISVTYLNSRGEHMFFIRNTNAPLVVGGPLPDPSLGNVYQYDSKGIYRQNQMIVNGRLALSRRVSLFGFYTLNYANANVSGGGGGGGFNNGLMSSASFLSNSYDPLADYGRSAFDVRHRALVAGSIDVSHGFRLSPFIIINSGAPYNVTTGQDNNGDSLFNDRPILVSAAPCGPLSVNGTLYCTPIGTFNTALTPGTPLSSLVPINYGHAPGSATVNLRLSKSFGFGREKKGGGGGGGGGDRGPRMGPGLGGRGLSGGGGGMGGIFGGGSTNRTYNLTLSVMARNLLNSLNPGSPVGNLSSPFFGQPISIAGGPFSSASANRRIDLQVMFSF